MKVRRTALPLVALLTAMIVAPAASRASVSLDDEEVVFRYDGEGAEKVFVTGDFNNWNPTMDRMAFRDGVFEIRLFLLPGRYRYMFVVDGVETADPGNPRRDGEGYPYFIFRETGDGYEIVFEGAIGGEGRASADSYRAGIYGHGYIGRDERMMRAAPFIEADMDGGLEANLQWLISLDADDPSSIESLPVRANATCREGALNISVFSRPGEPGFPGGENLFSSAGPYGHSPWMFRRGLSVGLGFSSGIRTGLVYTDRIDGRPVGGTEEFLSSDTPEGETSSRTGLDSDMTGLTAGYSRGGISLDYFFRSDEGRGSFMLYGPPASGDSTASWTESAVVQGVRASFSRGAWSLEGIYAKADTRISPSKDDYGDRDWDGGERFGMQIGRTSKTLPVSAGWSRETVKGYEPGSIPEGRKEHDRLDASLSWLGERLALALALSGDFYDGATHIRFRDPLYDLWLDESVLEPWDMVFAGSEGIYSLEIELGERSEEEAGGPLPTAGLLKARVMFDGEDADIWLAETRAAGGIQLRGRLKLHIDARYIKYSHPDWDGDSGFLDTWAGLSFGLPGGSWVAAGFGRAPFSFDRWICGVTPYSRERFIMERILRGSFAGRLATLEKAEGLLEGDWRLSVQASLAF